MTFFGLHFTQGMLGRAAVLEVMGRHKGYDFFFKYLLPVIITNIVAAFISICYSHPNFYLTVCNVVKR